jgi:hypothetical protein
MRVMRLVLALCPLLLAGCGDSRHATAVDACNKAISDKLNGKTFALDRGDMLARARDESADVVHVGSTVVFDKGLSTEYQQTFDCRVRLGKSADVISLQFNWSKDDLKKVNSD